MTTQTVLLAIIAIVSLISAIDWWIKGEVCTGWAFFFFACGDVALAIEFAATKTPFGGSSS